MKTLQHIHLKAVKLWEIILLFILFSIFMYYIMHLIAFPAGATSGLLQTQWVIFIASTIGILYIIIQHRRTKLLEIHCSDGETRYRFENEQKTIHSLRVHPFLHKRLPARILKINDRFYLIMSMYKNPFDQIDSSQKAEFGSKIQQLESISVVIEPTAIRKMDWLPFVFNASFYLLIIGALTFISFLILKISQS